MHRPDWISKAIGIIVMALIGLPAAPLHAQDLLDPTAPPDRFLQALEGAASHPGEDKTPSKAPTLNKPVMIVERALGGEWRRHTVINGKVRTTGGQTDVGTIRSINSTGVKFADDEGTETRSVVDHTVVKKKPGQRAKE